MPKTTNTYGAGGELTSTMEREGMDIGPAPDFFGELEQIRKKLKPVSPATPRQQASALSPEVTAPTFGQASQADEYEYVPTFGVSSPGGGGLGHGWMSGYMPGQIMGAGNTPTATGYQRVRKGGR